MENENTYLVEFDNQIRVATETTLDELVSADISRVRHNIEQIFYLHGELLCQKDITNLAFNYVKGSSDNEIKNLLFDDEIALFFIDLFLSPIIKSFSQRPYKINLIAILIVELIKMKDPTENKDHIVRLLAEGQRAKKINTGFKEVENEESKATLINQHK